MIRRLLEWNLFFKITGIVLFLLTMYVYGIVIYLWVHLK